MVISKWRKTAIFIVHNRKRQSGRCSSRAEGPYQTRDDPAWKRRGVEPAVAFGHPVLRLARSGCPVPFFGVVFGKEASAAGDGVGVGEERGDGVSESSQRGEGWSLKEDEDGGE